MAALSARDEGAEGLRHIVRYYQAWIEDERLYIQTELCDASLESRVRRGRFLPTPPAVWGFLRQMLLALELLHARGLVHLDLKPGNIFVKGEDPRGSRVAAVSPPGGERARGARLGRRACHAGEDCYKLGDFGLATTARARGDVVEGDARYMSKELLDDDDFMSGGGSGPRDLTKCDVFSLGATAFELVRRAPLAANGPAWHALRDGAAAFPATVPRDLRDVIAGLVHPNPAWRPTAAAALQHPELQSEVQRMALQLAAEKQHVQQYREDVARLSKHRLARSNTWA